MEIETLRRGKKYRLCKKVGGGGGGREKKRGLQHRRFLYMDMHFMIRWQRNSHQIFSTLPAENLYLFKKKSQSYQSCTSKPKNPFQRIFQFHFDQKQFQHHGKERSGKHMGTRRVRYERPRKQDLGNAGKNVPKNAWKQPTVRKIDENELLSKFGLLDEKQGWEVPNEATALKREHSRCLERVRRHFIRIREIWTLLDSEWS